MSPEILTYVLAIVAAGLLASHVYRYQKNRKNGHATVIKPLQLILTVLVLVISIFAIVTGHTYEDIVSLIESWF